MMHRDNRLTPALSGTWPWQFKLMLTSALVLLGVNTAVFLYKVIPHKGDVSGDTYTLSGGVLPIAVLLLICQVGAWLRIAKATGHDRPTQA